MLQCSNSFQFRYDDAPYECRVEVLVVLRYSLHCRLEPSNQCHVDGTDEHLISIVWRIVGLLYVLINGVVFAHDFSNVKG